jgi:hypothetical protein
LKLLIIGFAIFIIAVLIIYPKAAAESTDVEVKSKGMELKQAGQGI